MADLIKSLLLPVAKLDETVAKVLNTSGGASRRVVQDMITLAVQNGGAGTGVSAADKEVLAGFRWREPLDEAAPTGANWSPRPSGFRVVIAVGAAPAPDDRLPGDLHFLTPPTGGDTATTSFQVADGSAWPQPWVLERTPTGGGSVVTGGMGVLSTGSKGGYAGADAVAERYGVAQSDTEWLFTFRHTSPEAYLSLVLRSDRANLDPSTGVVVGLHPTKVSAAAVDQGTYTAVGSQIQRAHTPGVDYRAHIVLSGPMLQVRTWPAAQPEPAEWDITGTVPEGVSGYGGFTVAGGKAAVTQSVAVDEVQVTNGLSGYGTSYGQAYGAS